MMKNKIVLITGANGELGTIVTKSFLNVGAKVIGAELHNNNETPAENFFPRQTDLSNSAEVQSLIKTIVDEFGGIDAVVHTVGGFAGGKSLAETPEADFEKMLTLNLRTAFYLFKAVIPVMQKNGAGRIIAVGSRSAVEPSPLAAVYGASKAALLSLVQSAAAEVRDSSITVNAVLPATIDTPRNRSEMSSADFSRWVSAEKIAATILWLASDAASEINGALIPIYGKS